ncbi:hypothetical protein ACHAPT_006903 [Fusarium lateritium]
MFFSLLPLFLAALGALATPITSSDEAITARDANPQFKNLPNTLSPDFPLNDTNAELVIRDAPPHSLDARGAGGYLGSCKDIRFYISDKDMKRPDPAYIHSGYFESPRLVARCPDMTGEMKCTSLELGECMVNVNGQLTPGPGGLWHKSCTQCIMSDGGKDFWCHCWSGLGGHLLMSGTTINLGKFPPLSTKYRSRFADR